jgi:hypothetical protein
MGGARIDAQQFKLSILNYRQLQRIRLELTHLRIAHLMRKRSSVTYILSTAALATIPTVPTRGATITRRVFDQASTLRL